MSAVITTFDIRLAVVSPFLFKGMTNTRIGIDAACLRDASGRPVIPASQVRGVLRAALEQMVRAGYAGLDTELLFGSESAKGSSDLPRRGRVLFSDLVANAETRTSQHVRVEIDDETGTAKKGHLLFLELAAPIGAKVVFSGTVTGRFSSVDEGKAFETAVRKALNLIPSIGSLKSAGFGAVDAGGCSIASKHARKAIPAAPQPVAQQTHAFRVTFDRPVMVDSERVTDNVFKSGSVVPGAAFKGALAERLEKGGLTITEGALGEALSALRISHAIPVSKDGTRPVGLPLAFSLVTDGARFVDLAHLPFGAMPEPQGRAWDFVASSKDAVKGEARVALGLDAFDPTYVTRTHVQINDDRQIAEESKLHSTLSLDTSGLAFEVTVDTGKITDPAQAALLLAAMNDGLDGVGRTDAHATFEPVEKTDMGPAIGDEVIFTLVTPAVLFDPTDGSAAQMRVEERFGRYFAEYLGGAVLENAFVRLKMAGGYIATRHRPYGKAYYPFVLARPGSTFRLRLPDSAAKDAFRDALRYGLPVAKLGGKRPDWRSCPYLPENGYGEIRLGLTEKAQRVAGQTMEATHVW